MKVAVIEGGPSSEAAVSRASAAAVARALIAAGHQVDVFELDRQLAGALLTYSPQVVFPVVHGAQGEDGCLQGLLEVLQLPYVGSDVRASAVAADKVASKVFFEKVGLPLARDSVLFEGAQGQDPAALFSRLKAEVGEGMILKPARGGSTIGMTRLLPGATTGAFEDGLALAFGHDSTVLVEEFITGQEVTCAILESDDGPQALPVTLITSQATEWYDFESKYAPGGSRHQCPAPFDPELTGKIQGASVRAHRAVGARDLSRSDFLVQESGEIVLLELNTLPGMTDVSLFPEAAAAGGIAFSELVDLLVRRAADRVGGPTLSAPVLPGR